MKESIYCRWGARREDSYKKELCQLFNRLNKSISSDTLIMWTTTTPASSERVKGGVLIKQVFILKNKRIFLF